MPEIEAPKWEIKVGKELEAEKKNKEQQAIEQYRKQLQEHQKQILTGEQIKIHDKAVETDKSTTRKTTESIATSVESTEMAATDEELATQLNNLAKNKKLNFSWTNDTWKCSREEKRLATASAKVFQDLIANSVDWESKMQQMVELCKNQWWELQLEVAKQRKSDLWINSKESDIISFYQSYKEYQNSQTKFWHLRNLMGFFCQHEFLDTESLSKYLSTNRSKKITNKEISKVANKLYVSVERQSEYGHTYTAIIDTYTWQEISRRPKDWRQRASFEIIKTRLKEQENPTTKMLTLLWDYNLDGEVNSWDAGYKTWSQLLSVFRRVVETKKLEDKDFNDEQAIKNLVAYAYKMWIDIDDSISSVEWLYQWMTDGGKWYDNTRKIQNFIKNLSVDFWDVLVNPEDAQANYIESVVSAIKLEKNEQALVQKAAIEKTKAIIKDNESVLKERFSDTKERASIMQQIINQLPWMLIQSALEQQAQLGVWVSMSLDQIIQWLSAWLTMMLVKGKPVLWLMFGKNVTFQLNDTTKLNLSGGVGVWFGCMLIVSSSLELVKETNSEDINESLDIVALEEVSLWWNIAYIHGKGVSAWWHIWLERNKKAGIEKWAANLNNQIKSKAEGRISEIAKYQDRDEQKKALKEQLRTTFKNSSEEALNTATDNLMIVINQLNFTKNLSDEDKELYAQVVADVFSEQRRNEAIIKIWDRKWKLSWGKLWIQFFNSKPTLVVVAKFTKYYNVNATENERSKARRIDATINGTWNKNILKNGEKIWKEHIDQINNILKLYGAKGLLTYIDWTDNKAWRIVIPTSLANGVWVNVRVAESLKWYVQQTEWWFSFPANTVYRILQETWWNQKSITLNVGSGINETSDIQLWDTRMSELIGDEELMGKIDYKFTEKSEITTIDGFEYKTDFLDGLFISEIIESLKYVDSSDRKKFSEFMKNKTAWKETFEESITDLLTVLGDDPKYKKIKDKLSSEIPDYEKQLIMDRVMAIASYTNVHTQRWLEAVINGNKDIKGRWEYYKDLRWPNGQSIFDKISFDRDWLINEIKSDWNYEVEMQSNLLWATAFYHRYNTAKWLALTWLWATTVLWWKMKEIEEKEEIEKVQDWFLWGESLKAWEHTPGVLEKSPAEWSNLKKALTDYVKENSEYRSNLSENQCKDLLRWNEIELSLDNGRKISIKLDVKYMSYLMWECANESVGIQLNGLSIKTQEEIQHLAEWEFYLNEIDGTSSVDVNRKDVAIGGVFRWWKKQNDATTDPWEDEEPIKKPDATTNPGEDEHGWWNNNTWNENTEWEGWQNGNKGWWRN